MDSSIGLIGVGSVIILSIVCIYLVVFAIAQVRNDIRLGDKSVVGKRIGMVVGVFLVRLLIGMEISSLISCLIRIVECLVIAFALTYFVRKNRLEKE